MCDMTASSVQKRAKKGTSIGGQWVKGDVPAGVGENTVAKKAVQLSRQATAARVKVYRIKRRIANASGDTRNALKQKYKQAAADYESLSAQARDARGTAKKHGFTVDAAGRVRAKPKSRGAAAGNTPAANPKTTSNQRGGQSGAGESSIATKPTPPKHLGALSAKDVRNKVVQSHVYKKLKDGQYDNIDTDESVQQKFISDISRDYGFDEPPREASNIAGRPRGYQAVVFSGFKGNSTTGETGAQRKDSYKYDSKFSPERNEFGMHGVVASTNYNDHAKRHGASAVLTIGVPKKANIVNADTLDRKTRDARFDLLDSGRGNDLTSGKAIYLDNHPEVVALALGYDGIFQPASSRGGLGNYGTYNIFNRGLMDVE